MKQLPQKATLSPIIMEVENWAWKMTLVSKGAIFHFHDHVEVYFEIWL